MNEMDCFVTASDLALHDEELGENPLPAQLFPVSFRRGQGHG
jgi:hypothetical protein